MKYNIGKATDGSLSCRLRGDVSRVAKIVLDRDNFSFSLQSTLTLITCLVEYIIINE